MSRYAAVHNTEKCGRIAFFIKEVPQFGGLFPASQVVLPNGRSPEKGRRAECSECGESIHEKELVFVYEDKELPVAKNVYVIPAIHIGG